MLATRVRAQAAFKGVRFYRGRFEASVRIGSKTVTLAACDTAKEAAHAHDDAVRKTGGRVVNFPRAGTDELQAVKGEDERITLRNAGEGLPRRTGPPPTLKKHFKGVTIQQNITTAAVYTARTRIQADSIYLGCFCTEEEAARAYDDAMRKAGRLVVNFPRAGTNEVQAVQGEKDRVTLRNAGGGPPLRSGPLPTLTKHFKGVSVAPKATTAAVYAAKIFFDGMHTNLGCFCTEEDAARAYDDAVRKAGRTVVNFPRPNTNDVQAIKGEEDRVTLARHAAQQTARGAGSGAAASPHVIGSPPPKRSSASAVPAKRAAAHRFGSAGGNAAASSPPLLQPKREVDAAAVPAGIAASAQQSARRTASKRCAAESPAPLSRPPRLEPAGAPPPAKKQRLDEPAPAGIKLEMPSPVKLETPAAVKLEAPALPARPLRSPLDEHASAPTKKPRSETHAPANIKLEAPPAVKPETPAAPALPAVFGSSST